ncbi:enoyl-CoA hydratase-related protein [Oceanobacillus halotolerans]|uniref:enoyl-CoA hydratase-related protein n=1 Tax=Oceanobacillus halotolerans TaxID=2663380 RepID=UPI0013DCBA9D|nr:enoyl-CoA hydratase-related protein [Oceanobacillus halotolerans]
MEKSELVSLDIQNGIGTIYLNRGNKRNALNYEMWVKITELINVCNESKDVIIIILRSLDNKAFSAGADISEFKEIRYNANDAYKYNKVTHEAEKAIMSSSKPTIALVQGFCVGGGCEIALACDFRFSDSEGKFGITPAKLGLVYNLPGTKNLVDIVGPSKAKDILYTGRLIKAEEAYRIGLIDHIFERDKIVYETYQYAEMIKENAQFSVRGAKFVINKVLEGEIEDTDEISQLVLDSFETEDYKEGVNAFQEKRKPNFQYV